MWKLTNDWQQRLSSSYALVNGRPFFIDNVNILDSEDGECSIEDIQIVGYFTDSRDGDYVRIDMSPDSDVDFTYNPMGYVNLNGETYYIRRKPSRYYKYTATRRSLAPSGMGGRMLEECLNFLHENNYPTFEEAKTMFRNGWNKVAFSRDFAITSRGKVLYKGMEAGTHTSRRGIVFHDNFKQLIEKIEVGDETVR